MVIYETAVSLDGFLADAAGSLDWLFAVDEADAPSLAEFQAGVGVMVEGSATYEWVLREERLLEEPQKWQTFYGTRPTYVLTTRDLPVPPGADVRFVRGPIDRWWPDVVAASDGRDVWVVGGGDVVGQVLDAGHLDEIRVSVAPVTLGSGAPLLPRRCALTLLSAARAGQFARMTYAVGR